ncbi:MAG TPA: hypothetical protein VHU92_04545 [Streptosporangiaceae bacterium]|nr:hypothetical protein [Streptosporangiaceae bacterium]
MNADQVAALRALLAPTGWLERTRSFARALRDYSRTPHGLLVVGTPADEPWHMAAHLADESRLAEIPELEPTLVRWAPPAGAPAHLRVSIDRLRAATREETLLVVSPAQVPAELLERLSDVRRTGATILALDRGDPELGALAHEALAVPAETSPLSFDAAQHLVSAAAGEPYGPRPVSHRGLLASMSSMPGGLARAAGPVSPAGTGAGSGPGRHATASSGHSLRSRLAQLLDAVSGTPASPSD